jgi:hypothetical protein
MNPEPRYDPDLALLMQTLERLGVEVRQEPCDSNGGLVRVRDKRVLFLDSAGDAETRKRMCLDALRRLDLGGVHVPPRIRALLGEEEWT